MHSMYSIAAVCQHYIALHYIHNAHGEYHLVYLCVGMRAPGRRWNPGGWMQRRWGGNSSRWFIMSNNGAPKLVRHDSTCKSWRLYPVCPQFIAKANPTPASKLAFVTDVSWWRVSVKQQLAAFMHFMCQISIAAYDAPTTSHIDLCI